MKDESYASEVIKQLMPSKNEAILFLVETSERPFYDIEVVPIKMWALVESRHDLNQHYEEDTEITTDIKPVTFEDKYIDTVDPMDDEYIICYIDTTPRANAIDLRIKYEKRAKEVFNNIMNHRAREAVKNFNENQNKIPGGEK